jgi:hypothetical protein
VLYHVANNSSANGPDFTATLMRLTDMGVISLRKATYYKKRFGRAPKEVDDWQLVLNESRRAMVTDQIDKSTLDFVFDFVASKAQLLNDDNERPDDEHTQLPQEYIIDYIRVYQ